MMKPHEACSEFSGRPGPDCHRIDRCGTGERGTDHLSERPDGGPDVPGTWACVNNGGNDSGAGHHKGTGDKI